MLNYLGLYAEIIMFMNGVKVDTQESLAGNVRTVVGKGNTERDDLYSSLQVNELLYFKGLLKSEEIEMLREGHVFILSIFIGLSHHHCKSSLLDSVTITANHLYLIQSPSLHLIILMIFNQHQLEY